MCNELLYDSVMRKDERPPVESVDKALVLLLALQEGETLSVTLAAERLGVVPSTAHRLLNALRHRGFAVQDPSRLYRAGPATQAGPQPAHSVPALQRAGMAPLVDINAAVGETAHLMVRSDAHVLFIDGIECADPLRVAVRIGARMPAYCSAGGKALLADLADREVAEIHRDGLPAWPNRKITSMPMLLRHLQAARQNGFGVNSEETEPDVCGVGVAVPGTRGTAVAALTVAVPAARFAHRTVEYYADALRAAARKMSERLHDQPH